MSKKNNKKNKIEKNSSNFSEGGFDKSILSDYSQWREEYSEKEISEEDVLESTTEPEDNIVQEADKVDDLDFKSNLINSEVEDHTFSTDEEKAEITSKAEKEKENKEEKYEEKDTK